MKKESIMATAVCRWDHEDECFIVESPLWDVFIGVGETQPEAWETYKELLDDFYTEYKAGRVSLRSQPGRPKKNNTAWRADVNPETKEQMAALAKEMGISQGEVTEYLFSFYKAAKSHEQLVEA